MGSWSGWARIQRGHHTNADASNLDSSASADTDTLANVGAQQPNLMKAIAETSRRAYPPEAALLEKVVRDGEYLVTRPGGKVFVPEQFNARIEYAKNSTTTSAFLANAEQPTSQLQLFLANA